MNTLNEIVLESARLCGAGFDSTCTSEGTLTTLIDDAARDQGTDASFAAGGWIYRPTAAAIDRVRRISNQGFDPDTGTWTVTRAWSEAPDEDEPYQVYSMLPPIPQPGMPEDWRRLVNRALSAIWVEDEIVVGSGDGTFGQLFPLSDETGWTANEHHIKGVYRRTVDSDGIASDIDDSKGGRYWGVTYAGGVAQLSLSVPPTEAQDVVVVVNRSFPSLTDDSDETACPLKLVALRTRYELYRYLDATPTGRGQYAAEAAIALDDYRAAYWPHRPSGSLIIT